MDMKSKFYILVILALVMAIEATPEYPREERTRAQQYFDSIPESGNCGKLLESFIVILNKFQSFLRSRSFHPLLSG